MPNFESYCRCPGCGECEAHSQLDAERARADAAERDAGRYRWLRVNPEWLGWEHDFRPDEVDREIDREMDDAARKENPHD